MEGVEEFLVVSVSGEAMAVSLSIKLKIRCLLVKCGQNRIDVEINTPNPTSPISPLAFMNHSLSRRQFISTASMAGASVALLPSAFPKSVFATSVHSQEAKSFRISLAQWSLHKPLFDKELDNLDFAKVAKEKFGIEGVEYVNQFFKDKAKDETYLAEMKKRTTDLGVTNVLIMIDGEGALGDQDEAKRTQAVENHYKWVEAAKFLGCHSIRVNAETGAAYEEGKKLAADGLRRLSDFAKPLDINVIVENHGGLSSNGKWLSETIRLTEAANCGTLPDFGNFYEYDRYQGVTDMMPLAKAVSAKTYDFDEQGNETKIDFPRMMKIVADAGYHNWVGIEYEGSRLSPDEGIMATKKLLEKCMAAQG
jgi:L-ribulose-5-phosphate 3-epimerase